LLYFQIHQFYVRFFEKKSLPFIAPAFPAGMIHVICISIACLASKE